jgi:hypothetical protein
VTTSEHPQRVPPASVDGTRCDVAVIGGGVVGSATAWQLLERAPGASVVVLEPDPGYTRAASPLASGVVRQLFTRPENVLMSRYTHEVIDTWTEWVPPSGAAYPEDSPDLSCDRTATCSSPRRGRPVGSGPPSTSSSP